MGHGMDVAAGVPTIDLGVSFAGPRPSAPAQPVGRRLGSRPRGRTGFSSIPEAVGAIARGEMILVVDDHDRENEGDLVMAADLVTAADVNVMVTDGRGLLCLALAPERCEALELGPMVPENAGREETAFTVSIDLELDGSTGISAADRARTILRAVEPSARPEDFRRPGHVFPLRARPGGVMERRGHTEAAVELARMAGRAPAGMICEVMNADGTMARLPQLLDMAEREGLHLISIADLVDHRRATETFVTPMGVVDLPASEGGGRLVAYRDHDGIDQIAVVHGDVTGHDVPVRVHSECLTGDVFASYRCDCGEQLAASRQAIADAGRGVVVYLRGHEGRGIGIVDKLRAYALQDAGHDTVEANVELGHPVDARDYLAAAGILRDLGVQSVRLLTNNPAKQAALTDLGVVVRDRVPVTIRPRPDNQAYLATKRAKLGHDLPAPVQEHP